MPQPPIKVAVVFGGASGEHHVSIKSAKTVINALTQGENLNRFKVVQIYIDQKGRWWGESVAQKVLKEIQNLDIDELKKETPQKGFRSFPMDIESIDIWFPVLHGPNGEDGTIQGLFELTRKPFVGAGVLGSAIGMDKLAMKMVFSSAGLPQVPYLEASEADLLKADALIELINRIESKLGYPCFIKPGNLGSSVGITKAYTKKQLIEGLKTAANYDSKILVEKNVSARELECGVIGKKNIRTSSVGEIKHNSDWYDYHTKYSEGLSEVIIPAQIPKEITKKIQELSILACKAIAVEGIARADFFYEEDTHQIWINEINTLPGFTTNSMYPMLWEKSGLNIQKLVAMLVETARE